MASGWRRRPHESELDAFSPSSIREDVPLGLSIPLASITARSGPMTPKFPPDSPDDR
jgi:hypothetical protein